MLLNSGVLRSVEDRAAFVESFLAAASRDQAAAALCSANVPRPSASSLISLRHSPQAPRQRTGREHDGRTTAKLVGSGRWRALRSVDLGFCQIKGEPVGRRTFAEQSAPPA